MPRGLGEALRAAYESAQMPQQGEIASVSDVTDNDDVDDPSDEVKEKLKAVVGEDEQQSDSESDEIELEFANDLPEILGIEPEDFYNLKWKLADNQQPVKLGEIKDRLQQIDTERDTLAQERAKLEAQQKEFQERTVQAGQGAQQMSERMFKALGAISAIHSSAQTLQADWAARERENPGQVALERQRVTEQYQAAQAEYQAAQQEAQQEQHKAYGNWIREQDKILQQNVVGWSNPETQRDILGRVERIATERYGASRGDVQRIFADARMIQVLLDAEQGIKAREGAKKAVQKVRSAPKVLPKGVRLKNAQASKQRTQELEERARASRNKADVMGALRGILSEKRTR